MADAILTPISLVSGGDSGLHHIGHSSFTLANGGTSIKSTTLTVPAAVLCFASIVCKPHSTGNTEVWPSWAIIWPPSGSVTGHANHVKAGTITYTNNTTIVAATALGASGWCMGISGELDFFGYSS